MENNLNNGLLIRVDLQKGASAFVVIDSCLGNTSSGGLRIAEDMDELETRTLAREMTLKFSFIGLPRGGAKSGLQIPAGTGKDEKRAILTELGRRLAPIISAGIYYPGMDMNCGPEDLRSLYKGAGFNLPDKATDTSYFTAVSVDNAIQACVSEGAFSNRALTVAIEGFGSVGCYLATRLPADQFRIVALSTVKGAIINENGFSPELLAESRRQYGDELVSHLPGGRSVEMEAVLAADVDILVPAARTWSIHAGNVSNIRARVIVPAANAPYTAETIGILHERGIVSLPGFVTNSGGVYASSLYDSGVDKNTIEDISSQYYRSAVAALLRRSRELAQSPVIVAERVALQRLQAKMAGHGSAGRADRLLKRLFQKGLAPRTVYGRRIAAAFVENLQQLERQILEVGAC